MCGAVAVSGHRSLMWGGCVGSSFPFFCVWVFLFGLVVFAGVDGVLGDDFAGCFVYCDGVGSVDEQDDSLAVVGMAYAEVSESAGVAEGDFSVAVDAVVSDSPVGVAQLHGWLVFGCGGVCLVGCASVDGSVFAFGVVHGLEVLQLSLQVFDGQCWWLGLEPFFEGAVEAFDFSLGGWFSGASVFLFDVEVCQELLEGVWLSVVGASSC